MIGVQPLRGRGPASTTLDRVLLGLLLLGSALWMAQAYWEEVDLGKAEPKQQLHEQVLRNQAPNPYQYKLWLPEHAFAAVSSWTGAPLGDVYLGNTLISLLVLVLMHYAWLRALVDVRAAVLGVVLLAALSLCLFRIHYHHPYEFWGVALYCLLLRGIERDWPWKRILALMLLTGLVWEKHALLAPIWGLLALLRRRAFLPSLGRGLALLISALAIPVAIRVWLDRDLDLPRPDVDGDVPLAMQAWNKVFWYQGPYMAPFLLLLLVGWRQVPLVVRVLWLMLPAMAAAYALKHYNLHEARSFWALAPVFTATACAVFAAGRARPLDAAGMGAPAGTGSPAQG